MNLTAHYSSSSLIHCRLLGLSVFLIIPGTPTAGPLHCFFCLEYLSHNVTWLISSPSNVCSNVTYSIMPTLPLHLKLQPLWACGQLSWLSNGLLILAETRPQGHETQPIINNLPQQGVCLFPSPSTPPPTDEYSLC